MEFKRFINLQEPKLIEIKEMKKIIFVGDTHGDLETSQKIIKNYLKPGGESLSGDEYKKYCSIVEKFPLAFI